MMKSFGRNAIISGVGVLVPFLISCASSSKSELETVAHVDIPRYMGSWYVIANIPTSFEKGAFNAIENYTWNESEKRIDINYTYNKDSFNGPQKSIPQKGFIYDANSNAEWRIQVWWPLKFSYLIQGLANDYSDVIVGVPSRKYVWIMSRTPQMKEDRYLELVEKVKSLGYDVSKLEKVPQAKK